MGNNQIQVFDKNKFAELLKLAQGNRTQKEFSLETGISIGHLSRLYNAYYDKKPKFDTLKKIAAVASQDVNIKMLFEAAGYSFDEISSTVDLTLPILTFLKNSDFDWSYKIITDLTLITFESEEISEWYFDNEIINTKSDFLIKKYGRIAQKKLHKNVKYTLITNDRDLFNMVVDNPPYNLSLLISIVLVDLSNGTFGEEKYLETFIDISDHLKSKYALIKKD